jgi:hypothetical protein
MRGIMSSELKDLVNRAEAAVLRGNDMMVAPWLVLALVGENRKLETIIESLDVSVLPRGGLEGRQ